MANVTVFNPTNFLAFNGQVTVASGVQLSIRAVGGSLTQNYFGSGFTYLGFSVTGGTVNRITLVDGPTTYYDITGLNHSAPTVAGFVTSGDSAGLNAYLFSGADTINYLSGIGAAVFAYAGNDTINGGAEIGRAHV